MQPVDVSAGPHAPTTISEDLPSPSRKKQQTHCPKGHGRCSTQQVVPGRTAINQYPTWFVSNRSNNDGQCRGGGHLKHHTHTLGNANLGTNRHRGLLPRTRAEGLVPRIQASSLKQQSE